mmetsp:Transcript_30163/g.47227  ORF Transcript_30163/g.47227 Transcript_30163/m.47227 type:complete len:316 (+) Transcript_30163:884-1831(+)
MAILVRLKVHLVVRDMVVEQREEGVREVLPGVLAEPGPRPAPALALQDGDGLLLALEGQWVVHAAHPVYHRHVGVVPADHRLQILVLNVHRLDGGDGPQGEVSLTAVPQGQEVDVAGALALAGKAELPDNLAVFVKGLGNGRVEVLGVAQAPVTLALVVVRNGVGVRAKGQAHHLICLPVPLPGTRPRNEGEQHGVGVFHGDCLSPDLGGVHGHQVAITVHHHDEGNEWEGVAVSAINVEHVVAFIVYHILLHELLIDVNINGVLRITAIALLFHMLHSVGPLFIIAEQIQWVVQIVIVHPGKLAVFKCLNHFGV